MKRSNKTEPRGCYSPRSTHKHVDHPFWEWFFEANPEISKRDFLKELEVDNNSQAALERVFAKMNRSASKNQSKFRSGKRSGGQ